MYFYLGSLDAVKLDGLINKATLLRSVRKLSPLHQTSSLEAFHSLLLQFVPKHTAFSYMGMHARYLHLFIDI